MSIPRYAGVAIDKSRRAITAAAAAAVAPTASNPSNSQIMPILADGTLDSPIKHRMKQVIPMTTTVSNQVSSTHAVLVSRVDMIIYLCSDNNKMYLVRKLQFIV